MKLLTDLKVIETLAEERADANWRFRSFLKNIDMEVEEIDAVVHRHYEAAAAQIDCCACGNCCRVILPTLDNTNVKRLAAGLGISADSVVSSYLVRDEDEELTLKQSPCPFLEGNCCSVYEHRPEACRSYRHLHKEDFVFRLSQAVGNCSVCPISFHVYEQLKEELWH